MMKLYQNMVDAIRAAQKQQAVLGRLQEGKSEDMFLYVIAPVDTTSRFQITDYESPVVERFVAKALQAQTQAQIVTAAIALERDFLRHHHYPARLADLVPMFLKGAPIDYMDGKDLGYHPQPDGSYLLYSVGTDGVDDGGDPTPPANKTPGFLNGRDWVWTGVATEQEVSAYEAGAAQKEAQKQKKPEDRAANKLDFLRLFPS